MHYIPILKDKEAELRALSELEPDIKPGLTPLFDVSPLKARQDPDSWVLKFAKKLGKAWLISRPVFVDGAHIAAVRVSTGEHILSSLVQTSIDCNINIVPVTGLSRGEDYQEAIRDILSKRREFGACLRLAGDDFTGEFPSENIADLLKELGVDEEDMDLLLDFGEVLPNSPLAALMYSYLEGIFGIQKWRSVTVAATAFPSHLGEFEKDSISLTPRAEWKAWQNLLARKLQRRPQFGDYGIQHPKLVEFDPKKMKISAALRYTAEQDWLIARGRMLKGGKYGQVHNLCAMLVNRPEYKGPDFSAGDRWIMDCANRKVKPGSPMIWRRVGTVHHLTLVVRQLASLAVT